MTTTDENTFIRQAEPPKPRVFFWRSVETVAALVLVMAFVAGVTIFWGWVMQWVVP